MEYGRLVVLGYSSYRVAMTPRRPRAADAEPPRSFGLAELTAPAAAEAADGPAVPRASPGRAGAESGAEEREGGRHRPRKALGQLWEPLGAQNAHFVMQRRARGNGAALRRFHHFGVSRASADPAAAAPSEKGRKEASNELKAVTKRMMRVVEAEREKERRRAAQQGEQEMEMEAEQAAPFLMCIPMNDKDACASVTEFHADPETDMFQIGRMPCRQNDFVIPGPRVGASGTISRYSARLLCSREPPYECRLFAGGFDASNRMSTAGHALKYCVTCGKWMKRVGLDHGCVSARMELLSKSASTEGNQSNTTLSSVVMCDTSEQNREEQASLILDHYEMRVDDAHELPLDGLTKNGVRVWLPEHKQWFEVSVNGNLYPIEGRSATPSNNGTSGRVRNSAFNRPTTGADGRAPVLTDGAIIDLGGVQLQFQSPHGPRMLPSADSFKDEDTSDDILIDAMAPMVLGRGSVVVASVAKQLDILNVQCPVQLHPLRFTRPEPGEPEVPRAQIPHVFPACGHVFGYDKRIASAKTCPLCRAPGNLVQLLLKENSQLQSVAERHAIPECVLNPCGHAISSKLAAHYSALLMPNGRAICPFCAVHLDLSTPYSRLYLYSEDDY